MTNSRTDGDGLLVIGYGNSLRGDDGMGPSAAKLLRVGGIDALDVYQLTPELAERIAGARVVFFLDADAGLAPGEIAAEKLQDAASGAVPMEHCANPADLLRLAREVYGTSPEAWLMAMGGADFELGDSLSDAGKRAVSKAVAEVRRRAPLLGPR